MTPECYEKTKEKLKGFIEEEGNMLAEWLEWWDQRKGFLFRAFALFGPRMNLAESVHGGWAKKDPVNMTLLKVAEADVRKSKILDVEYKGLRAGTSTARGWGTCSTERQQTTHFREIKENWARKCLDTKAIEMEKRSTVTHHTGHQRLNENRRKKQNKKLKSQSKAANEHLQPENTPPENRPVAISRPARQVPQFGAFVIGLLQYHHPSVRVCYGCGADLKPEGMMPELPHDLVVISRDKRSYYDTTTKTMKQNQHISNVYFHLNPNCVTVRHQFFIPGLVKVLEDLVLFLDQEHKCILQQAVGLVIP